MAKNSGSRKKKRLLKVAGLCVLAAAAVLLPVISYQVDSSHRKSLESQKYIYRCISEQLNIKEPNVLTAADFEKLEELQIILNGITTTKPLLKLKNLKLIDFKYGPSPKLNINIDYEPLAKLQKLRDIRISVMEGIDAVLVRDKLYEKVVPFLKMLRPRTKPFDLDWLGKLKQIESLSLSYSEMKNYDALASLPDLRQLGLGRTTINDPAFLAKLSNLRMLNLRGLRNITDFSSLAQLTNLQNLDISATQLSDIKLLEGLTKLQYLNLNSTKIKDIAPLKNLISLQELHLQDCENISDRQIEDLQKNLPELKILRCSRS